ncbi:MAG TPA: UDP-N-acetylmuramyl-tripeptide synthetase [Candidatus Paceibacterota bacterium]|nr:UDP-N-acetylmuramyl-tripeptide synthetase [Candidatus Paceibacterota bacterium]
MQEKLEKIKKMLPRTMLEQMRPLYHYALSYTGKLVYNNPSKDIFVIGVTGTKGKSSTAEILNAILEEAGYKTAILSTVRFKIGDETEPNLMKMTMPGRFFVQKFLRRAVDKKCDYAIVEMTSEGAKNYRHRFVDMNALIFTNISPEHIESHGSFENYLGAKLQIAKRLEHGSKPSKTIVVNEDDDKAGKFLAINVPNKITYSIKEAKPFTLTKEGSDINLFGVRVQTSLPGEFNVYNILAAAKFAQSMGVKTETIKKAIEKLKTIPGRLEKIEISLAHLKFEGNKKPVGLGIFPNFSVIVDYAHTADSLEKVYKVFKNERKICVLGSCGGGRDKWKRPLMGEVADKNCDEIILTDEDPYDDDIEEIIQCVASGVKQHKPKIILDRREAIREALRTAKEGDAVIITGKGTDPFIMGPNGTKKVWSDKKVAEEELIALALERNSKS